MKVGQERMKLLGQLSGWVVGAESPGVDPWQFPGVWEATGHELCEVTQLFRHPAGHVGDEHQAVDAYRVAQDSGCPLDRGTLRGREARVVRAGD